MERTIAAISTPQGNGGIAVIRISGEKAIDIADKVFFGKDKLISSPTHTVHYGFIKNMSGEKVDEVLVTVMHAPRTFTCEDVVEISTHGGIASKAVLDTVIRAGAYMAEPGEFTRRAFLNGRIDLSQAEAVIDIINAKNSLANKNALSQLEGKLSKEIRDVRDSLVHLAAQMQVIIDYPDEDLADVTTDDIRNVAYNSQIRVQKLLSTADSGKMMRDGIRTAIVGKPNVGKSSLLNALAREDRAIVTDIAGTTRDVIEEYVNIDGIPLVLTDTAGIRNTDDVVEKIGVERSMKSIDTSDLVIVMLDGSRELEDEDKQVIEATSCKQRIIIVNKSDLDAVKWDINTDDIILRISTKTGEGLDALAEKISEIYNLGMIDSGDGTVITNMRHKTALINADEALGRVVETIDMNMPSDIASIDINMAIDALGEITGETVSDSVVAEIFHNFCVGK